MIYDVAICGAGPAGLATAIHARRLCLRAIVLERRRPPLDKPCGEGLMPGAVRELADLGVRLDPAVSRPLAGVRYRCGELEAAGRFPGAPGLGVRRTRLSAALIERAAELGVELRFGTAVTGARSRPDRVEIESSAGPLSARALVGADGLASAVARAAGLAVASGGKQRAGARAHFAVAPWTDRVEVHFGATGEAYVTPVGPTEIGVALLGPPGPTFGERLAGFPALAERLRGAAATSQVGGRFPLRRRVERLATGRIALVGDAAGYVDAVTGEGIAVALLQARALATRLATGAGLDGWTREARRIARPPALLTELVLRIAARPEGAAELVRTLALHDGLFDRLLALAADARRLRDLRTLDLLRLLPALVAGCGP